MEVVTVTLFSLLILLSAQQGDAQLRCYSNVSCANQLTISNPISNECCVNDPNGLSFDARGESCSNCVVYGFVDQANGSYIRQAPITAAEGTTVNLTIFYWKGITSSTSFRNFDLTTSGSADSSDFQISPTPIPQVEITPVQISVQLLNDQNASEMEEETLTLKLTERNVAGRTGDFVLSTVAIKIRNINIEVSFNGTGATVEEGKTAEICVSKLFGTTGNRIELNVGVMASTASSSDYTLSRTELTITSTTRETCLSVFASDDDVALEGEETVMLTLTGPDSVTITNSRFEVTIIDTDVITFGFSQVDRVATEGDGVITVEIERNRETQKPIGLVISPVEYSAVNGTVSYLPSVEEFDPLNPNMATAGIDFNSSLIMLDVQPGTDNIMVNIQIVDDNIHENREYFAALLTLLDNSVSGAKIGATNNAILLSIMDNDLQFINFVHPNYTLTETDSNEVYNLTVTKRLESQLTYSITQRDFGGTADTPLDYTLPTNAYLLQPGQKNFTYSVTIVGDNKVEVTEYFDIRLTPASNVAFLTSVTPVRIFITDDDEGLTVSFQQTSYSVDEGSNVSVCFVVDNQPPMLEGFQFQFNINVTSSDGTARAGSDYTAISTTLPGDSFQPQCVTAQTIQDLVIENNETFTLSGSVVGDFPVVVTNTAEIIIHDDDTTAFEFNVSSVEITEGERREYCQPNLTAVLEKEFVVSVVSISGSAQSGKDYTAISHDFTYAPGADLTCFAYDALMDSVYEEKEDYFLQFVSSDPSVIINQDGRLSVFILDNTTVSVEFEKTIVTIGEGGNASVYVTLRSGFDISADALDLTAHFVMRSGITANQVTISPASFQLTSSQQRVSLTVSVLEDNAVDSSESFSLSLSTRSPRVDIANQVTFEVVDNDVEVGLSRTMYTSSEAEGKVEVCVGITRGSLKENLTVNFNTINGSAKIASDFKGNPSGGPFTLTLVPGSGPLQCIDIAITADNIIEAEEEFTVELTLASGGETFATVTIGSGSATVTITRDPLVIGFEMTAQVTSEMVGVLELCAVTSHPVERMTMASFSVIGGTAKVGDDYQPFGGGTMYLTAGNMRLCINITIVASALVEGDETIIVGLTSNEPDAQISPNETTITIASDGDITVGFSQNRYNFTEGTTGTLVVQKSGSFVSDIIFRVVLPGLVNQTQTFAAGTATPNEIDISFLIPNNDVALESDRVLSAQVEIISPMSQVALGISTATVIIHDDDVVTLSFARTSITVSEAVGQVMLCVLKSAETAIAVPFLITDQPGTATEPADYSFDETAPQMLAADANQACFTVNITNDGQQENTETFTLILMPLIMNIPVPTNTSTVTIIDNDMGVGVNDTVVGDPFFTVPIDADPQQLNLTIDRVSICYEIHGVAGSIVNLVNDECTNVNARYVQPHSGVDINVIDTIAIEATDDVTQPGSAKQTHKIQVNLNGCTATINGTLFEGIFQLNKLSVRKTAKRVRVSVPNGKDVQLVMWISCQTGTLPDPSTGNNIVTDMIQFVIARGTGLSEESHGLLGQFWNVAFNVALYTGDRGHLNPDYTAFTMTYRPGNANKSRQFVSLLEPRSWDRTKQPCLYSGNRQGGPIGDIDTEPNDSVIEGIYTDYIVTELFASDCKFCTMFK